MLVYLSSSLRSTCVYRREIWHLPLRQERLIGDIKCWAGCSTACAARRTTERLGFMNHAFVIQAPA